MTKLVDDTDARLLDLIQQEFPLEARPFDQLGRRLGLPPAEIVERISRLKTDGLIRQISAIFDSGVLGYHSSLVAFEVEGERLDEVAAKVCAHPGVSHCYARDDCYNLWFTITIPGERDIEREVGELARLQGVLDRLVLPALKVFKIGVFFSMSDVGRQRLQTPAVGRPLPIAGIDQAVVRALQRDLPLTERPFDTLAKTEGLNEEYLLQQARSLLKTGAMRRFGAVLRHTRAGYTSNAMVCWKVPSEMVEQVGTILASHAAVSHCYERSTYPKWPYSLYTMVHSRTDPDLTATIAELARLSGISACRVLRTLKEYKKSRVAYFEG